MPANIVNLNRFKKARARAEKEPRAEENRARFGRTKEQKTTEQDEVARREALLDGARRERSEEDGEPT